jgi:hypothetical protein
VYYIQHEILSEKEENIVDFMAGSVPEDGGDDSGAFYTKVFHPSPGFNI